jgi:acyl dehydratase
MSPPQVGDGPPDVTTAPLGPVDFVRWVGALNDVDSPVHYDSRAAQDAGYDSVIAPGMLQAAMLVDHAVAWLGAENVRRCRVRFLEPVLPGDALTLTARVTASADDRVEVELECRRPAGAPAVRGWMTFAVDNRTGA